MFRTFYPHHPSAQNAKSRSFVSQNGTPAPTPPPPNFRARRVGRNIFERSRSVHPFAGCNGIGRSRHLVNTVVCWAYVPRYKRTHGVYRINNDGIFSFFFSFFLFFFFKSRRDAFTRFTRPLSVASVCVCPADPGRVDRARVPVGRGSLTPYRYTSRRKRSRNTIRYLLRSSGVTVAG